MIEPGMLITFVFTNLALNVTPGPAVIQVTSHAYSQGWRRAQLSVLGILCGNALYCLLSAAGLGALLMKWPQVYQVLRYAGALYLVWLALKRLWHTSQRAADGTGAQTIASRPALFHESLLLQLSNPKSLLFFCALLPVFIGTTDGSGGWAILLLGLLAIALEYPVLLGYTLVSSTLASRANTGNGRWYRLIDIICALLLLLSASLVLFA